VTARTDAAGTPRWPHAYLVLCPTGLGGQWMLFRITTDLAHAASTARTIAGIVVPLPVIYDSHKEISDL
jgi:hypothetical protein